MLGNFLNRLDIYPDPATAAMTEVVVRYGGTDLHLALVTNR